MKRLQVIPRFPHSSSKVREKKPAGALIVFAYEK